MSSQYKWTDENRIALIREFKKRPMLWNPNNVEYYNKISKLAAWEDIGLTLQIPAFVCKTKMAVLKSSLRRVKAKMKRSRRDGDDSVQPNWWAFKEMDFLLGLHDKRAGPATDNNDETQEIEFKFEDEDPLISTPQASSRIRTKSSSTNEDEPIISEDRIRNEEIDNFTRFISAKMKRYSEYTKNAVQQKISEIIFRADQKYYETTNFMILDDKKSSDSETIE